MNITEKIAMIERTDSLIRRKGTGTPKQLASRLNISERYVYKLIKLMKAMNAPIYYCKQRKSYCYESEVEFSIGFQLKNKDNDRIAGGFANIYNIFFDTAQFVR